VLTRILVAINVIAFVWENASGALSTDSSLVSHGALVGTAVQHGEWWRILTAAFLHGGVMHIVFNMIALWQVGTFVEMIYGTPRMGLIYAISLVGSGLLVTYATPNDVTVGASGAIFGLFGALLVAGLRLGQPGRALLKQSAGIIAINLVISFTIPNISKEGHIGGLVAGIIAAFILYRQPRAVSSQVPVAAEAPVYAQRIDPQADAGVTTIEHDRDR
jgi:rhomboid protease GluP